ncbi:hypothetical protein [Nocardia sp. NPDC052566]|uniref:hypothetical protein n=1 Tax=Nocardia sp. NPDC052566 TaxID=3364330 RepID=UPI0037C60A18
MATLAAAIDHEPAELADYPLLAVHRVLDRLAAMAFDAADGVSGAPAAFAEAVTELCRVVTDSAPSAPDDDSLPLGDPLPPTPDSATPDTLIDHDGVNILVDLAFRFAGRAGANVIRQLSDAATFAECQLPNLGSHQDLESTASILLDSARMEKDREADSPATGVADSKGLSMNEFGDIVGLVRAAPSQCSRLFLKVDDDDLVRNPPPQGPAPSIAGIQSVTLEPPCGAAAIMTIHGHGFGTAPAGGIRVLVATWDPVLRAVYRPVAVSSWSDTTVVVASLPANLVSGAVAFADPAFIGKYNEWVDGRNRRVAAAMHGAGCPGRWQAEIPYSATPSATPATSYTAGSPHITADVAPTIGTPVQWNARTLHLQTGQEFKVSWQSYGAETVVLRALDSGAATILAAAGHTESVVLDSTGQIILATATNPIRGTFGVDAENRCATVRATVGVMVTGPALQPASVTVYQAVAGGDVEVGLQGTTEVLNPSSGPSIPLVADKRSVAVIDWWPALPQMPPGETLTARATLKVSGPLIAFPGVTLRPSVSTADPAPLDKTLELQSGPGFSSLTAYRQWLAAGNDPHTFNVVLPPQVCQGGVIVGPGVQGWTLLEATVEVSSQDGPTWTLSPGNNVTFHPRRRVRIRYRAFGLPATADAAAVPAPTDEVCRAGLRAAASILPIPDPEIVTLPGSPTQNNGHLIEDLIAERGGTETPAWRDEIWLVVGPLSPTGGFAPGPWVGSSDATARTLAHEMSHLFGQNHLALCGIVGDDPASFPNRGNVGVPGFDMWNNGFVQNALDIMVRTYCPEPTWPSPERWRRVFLKVGRK